MLSEERLFEQYHQRGIVQNGELYLRAATAFDFVVQCEENDLAIIGIEGFTVENGEIRPQLDLIGDFSLIETSDWAHYRDACQRLAKNFVCKNTTQNEIMFTFVLLSQEEWADDFREATGIFLNGQQPSLVIPQLGSPNGEHQLAYNERNLAQTLVAKERELNNRLLPKLRVRERK